MCLVDWPNNNEPYDGSDEFLRASIRFRGQAKPITSNLPALRWLTNQSVSAGDHRSFSRADNQEGNKR